MASSASCSCVLPQGSLLESKRPGASVAALPPKTSAVALSAKRVAHSVSRPSLNLNSAGRAAFGPATRARTVYPQAAAKWVLEPIGDGDSSHLDEAIERPGKISLEGEAFVVGRVPDRCDIAIPVPTVSGSHAKLEAKGNDLFVTDLNSTNGTFLNEQRLNPGVQVLIPNGGIVTFGDQHLAMFKAVVEAVDV